MTIKHDPKTIPTLSGPALVAVYNGLCPGKPVKRFTSRKAGVDRVLRMLAEREGVESLAAPSGAAQREPAGAAARSTPPRAARRESYQPTGELRPPRPASKRGRLLAALAADGMTATQIAAEFQWNARDVADALRLLSSANGYVVYLADDGATWRAATPEGDGTREVEVTSPGPGPKSPKRKRR